MGDYSSVAQAMQGAAATPDQSMPSGSTWQQILGHLKDTFGESGLYMTPAGIPLSARDAYNSATTPMDPSEMATPPDAHGNRIPDLTSWQGWKNGFSDLYHAVGGPGLALTGIFAKTTDPAKLRQVEALEAAGHAPNSILNETGQFRNLNGTWKHEIDDSKSVVRSGQGVGVGPDSPLYHPDVEAAYPGIKGLKVDIAREGQNPGNEMSFYERMNTKNGPALQGRGFDPNDQKFVATHELQHGVSDQDGLLNSEAIGSNPYQWISEKEAREASYRANMTPEERMANPPTRIMMQRLRDALTGK